MSYNFIHNLENNKYRVVILFHLDYVSITTNRLLMPLIYPLKSCTDRYFYHIIRNPI